MRATAGALHRLRPASPARRIRRRREGVRAPPTAGHRSRSRRRQLPRSLSATTNSAALSHGVVVSIWAMSSRNSLLDRAPRAPGRSAIHSLLPPVTLRPWLFPARQELTRPAVGSSEVGGDERPELRSQAQAREPVGPLPAWLSRAPGSHPPRPREGRRDSGGCEPRSHRQGVSIQNWVSTNSATIRSRRPIASSQRPRSTPPRRARTRANPANRPAEALGELQSLSFVVAKLRSTWPRSGDRAEVAVRAHALRRVGIHRDARRSPPGRPGHRSRPL